MSQIIQSNGNLLPPDQDLQHFGLHNAAGELKCKPRAVRCRQCAERAGADAGGLLCIVVEDGAGNVVLCYYHSKGKFKNETPRGRWVIAQLPKGAKSRIICDHGHRCEITV